MARVTADDVNAYLPSGYPEVVAAGFGCEEVGDGFAVARWRYDPATLRPGGYISGPKLFTLADLSLWFAVFGAAGIVPMAVTSELSIRFIRPALGADALGRADLHSVSRRTVVGTVTIWMDGSPQRPVAVAQGTYTRPPSPGAAPPAGASPGAVGRADRAAGPTTSSSPISR